MYFKNKINLYKRAVSQNYFTYLIYTIIKTKIVSKSKSYEMALTGVYIFFCEFKFY